MDSTKYSNMPSFDDFEYHLKSYVDEENELVVGDPPEVFWMEIPIQSDDCLAYNSVYSLLNKNVRSQIIVKESELDSNSAAIIFTTYESLYEFLSAAQQFDDYGVQELVSAILDTLGFDIQ